MRRALPTVGDCHELQEYISNNILSFFAIATNDILPGILKAIFEMVSFLLDILRPLRGRGENNG